MTEEAKRKRDESAAEYELSQLAMHKHTLPEDFKAGYDVGYATAKLEALELVKAAEAMLISHANLYLSQFQYPGADPENDIIRKELKLALVQYYGTQKQGE